MGNAYNCFMRPTRRSFTGQQSILRIINPVIAEPLERERGIARAKIADHIAKRKKEGNKAEHDALAVFIAHLERLKAFRGLDPGWVRNFLYLCAEPYRRTR